MSTSQELDYLLCRTHIVEWFTRDKERKASSERSSKQYMSRILNGRRPVICCFHIASLHVFDVFSPSRFAQSEDINLRIMFT